MKIQSLYIDGFGKFSELSLSFSEGLNIIYGPNEAGKSTLHSFLHAMLYGLRKRPGSAFSKDSFHRFRPWKEDRRFRGLLEFHYDGADYLLRRDFSDGVGRAELFRKLNDEDVGNVDDIELRNNTFSPASSMQGSAGLDRAGINEVELKDVEPRDIQFSEIRLSNIEKLVLNLSGQEGYMPISDAEALLTEALEHFTENSYRNTVSIGQLKSATGREMVQELRNYLRSMESSGSAGLNADSVLSVLKKEKEDCQSRLVLEASKNYSVLIGEIRNMERELSQPRFHNLLPHYRKLHIEAKTEIQKLQEEKEELLLKSTQEREALRYAGFTKEDELSAQQKDTESLYQSYLSEQEKLSQRSGLSFFFQRLLLRGNVDNSRKEYEAKLSEILQKQLGESSISEDSMKQLRQRFSTLEKNFQALEEKDAELLQLTTELEQKQSEEKDYEQALREQYELRTEVEGKLQHLSNIKNRVEQLEKVLRENELLLQKIDALDLAIETISELSDRVRLSFGRYLNEEAGLLIRKITNNAYDSVWIDDQLNLLLNTGDGEVPLESVSSGTIDQIYLALRLATARLLLKDSKELLPLSFDDSFALYDEKRLGSTLRFIKEEYPGQILIFTCHKREQQLLKKSKEEFRLIEL